MNGRDVFQHSFFSSFIWGIVGAGARKFDEYNTFRWEILRNLLDLSVGSIV